MCACVFQLRETDYTWPAMLSWPAAMPAMPWLKARWLLLLVVVVVVLPAMPWLKVMEMEMG